MVLKMMRAAAMLLFLVSPVASAKTATQQTVKAAPLSAVEEARLLQFLDKDGGYRAKDGGYYNSKAGTYTDTKGGVLDNWKGYTYADGSYKSALGDYWDAPTSTAKLANGETVKPDGSTSAEVIKALRDSVEENGGYDKNFIRNSMMQKIESIRQRML